MNTFRTKGGLFFLAALPVILVALLFPPVTATAQTPTMAPRTPVVGTPTPGSLESTVNEAAESVAARTPIPPPTPGIVQREVMEFTERVGVDDIIFLGLSAAEWIDLGLSVLIFLFSFWAAVWFFSRVLRRLVWRTETSFDAQFLASVGQELKWLIGVLLLRFSVLRLTFIGGALRTLLNDLFFLLALLVVMRIATKLIDFGLNWYKALLDAQKRGVLDPALLMLKNAGKLLVIVTGVSIGLSHFGLVNNAVIIVLAAIAVLVLISVKDVMSDLIYGFIILVGQPFRVGDAIHVDSMKAEDWGWVEEIGARETHIRTRDNRVLVMPNASLGSDRVVNYMLPDPSVRVQTDLRLSYGSDFGRIEPLVNQTMNDTDGLLAHQPVDVMLLRFSRYGYIVRVRWWIANCEKDDEAVANINAALKAALDAADIEMGYSAVDLDTKSQLHEPASPSS